MPLIHVSLEPCTACVYHLCVIDLGNCLLCVEVMHHSAIHRTVLVKARENSQLRLPLAFEDCNTLVYRACAPLVQIYFLQDPTVPPGTCSNRTVCARNK